ncbi:fluoride efflux transporter FluC [Dietzia aerolata]|uniref:Fluoride-specific ion channel FluC n=1 Tax=Dietzia aerolata TaxID=595984 RepID=A0ABV5JMM6_9ACTN
MKGTVLALLLVGLGGAAGSAARAGVALALPAAPLAATLLVNVVGAGVLGLVVAALDGAGVSRRRARARLLLGTGFCGGFTTYSAVAVQTAELLRGAEPGTAVGYALVTLLLGAVATLLGLVLGGLLQRGAAASGPSARRGET